jgi:hypothetical protein
MRCKRCGGAIIHDLGDSLNGPRDYCHACGREPKQVETKERDDKELMSYHLDSKKEEEVKVLLRTDSIREIVTKTGVASETIRRIRNKNFTEGERAELKKRANVKGRNKRELKKRELGADLQNNGRNIPKNIPSTNSDGRGGQKIMVEGTKVCMNPKCGRTNPQPIDEFNKNAARPSGRESRCRTCTTQTQRDRKASIEKSSGGTGRSRKAPGNGRKKRQPRDPGPVRSLSPNPIISDAVTLDAQLLRAVKKSAILDFIKNELPRMVEETFA